MLEETIELHETQTITITIKKIGFSLNNIFIIFVL